MKTLCLLVVLGFGLKNVLADEISEGKVSGFLYNRCKQYSTNAAAYDATKQQLDSFLAYFSFAANLLPSGTQQFCEEERYRLMHSMDMLTREMRPCFPKEERYLPKFLNESFAELMHFMCANQGQNINNFFSTQGKDCMTTLKEKQAGSEVTHCFSKIFAPFSGVVRKDNLCEDLATAKKCFSMVLTEHCPDFVAFTSLNNKFFHAIRKPCDAGSAARLSSMVLLTIVAFFTSKILS